MGALRELQRVFALQRTGFSLALALVGVVLQSMR